MSCKVLRIQQDRDRKSKEEFLFLRKPESWRKLEGGCLLTDFPIIF